MAYTDTVLYQLRTVESAATRASGCEAGYKNIVAAEANEGLASPGRLSRSPFGVSAVRVCVFAGPRGSESDDTPPGDFVRGGVLPDATRDTLVAALVPSAAAPSCTRWSSRVALVRATDSGLGVTVELDGCRRIFSYGDNHDTLAQASPELVKLLENA